MIPVFICVAFSVFLLVDFKKYFIIFIALATWLQQFVFLSTSYSIFEFLSLFSAIVFFFQRDFRKDFPLKESFLFFTFSLIVTTYFAWLRNFLLLGITFTTLLFNVYIFWCVINSNLRKYLNLFIKWSCIFGCIIVGYALFETVTTSNPFIEYINSSHAYLNDFLITEVRFGIKRSQSIFSMHTTNGAISLALFCLLLYLKRQTNFFKSNKLINVLIVLLLITVFLTGARSAMIGCVICCLMFYEKKLLQFKYVLLLLVAGCILIGSLHEYIQEVLDSIFDTEKVSGSNTDMRSIQFEIAYLFLAQSFWFGHGLSYTWLYVKIFYDELLGAESLWIPVMIDQGFIGIMAYAFFFICCIVYSIKKKALCISFFVLGFLVYNSMSSLPGFQITYILIYIMTMIELKQLYPISKT